MIRLWNTQTGTIRRAISGFLDAVTEVQYTPDGRALRVKVVDQAAVLYDLATGRTSPAGDPAEAPTNDPMAVQMLDEGYIVSGQVVKDRLQPGWLCFGGSSRQHPGLGCRLGPGSPEHLYAQPSAYQRHDFQP